MNPKRVLPLLLIFLVLAGTYAFLTWRQARQESREQEARKLFAVKEVEITALTLKRANEEISLARTGAEWRLLKPLQAKADQVSLDAMTGTLAHLEMRRELGEQKDLKAFGLEAPALVVEFTAQGKPHRLSLGARAPGGVGYYALRDQDPRVLVISANHKESLDRPLIALRDRTLFSFDAEQVKTLKLRRGATLVDLEKTGPQSWRWVGRPQFAVRRDRVEDLLRQLHIARVQEFVAEAPRDLRPYGLGQPPVEVVVGLKDQGQERLALGARHQKDYYARKLPGGPVILVGAGLMERLTETVATLEDRRLWPGQLSQVHRLAWGGPPQWWTAVKDRDYFRITGPDRQELRQPGVQVEMALVKLQQLEYARLLPQASGGAAKPAFSLELRDASDKPVFHLEELGRQEKDKVAVRFRQGDQSATALTSLADYEALQAALARLTQAQKK
jgi:hypothetical protein